MQSQPGNYTFNALSQYRKKCLLLSTCSIMQIPFVTICLKKMHLLLALCIYMSKDLLKSRIQNNVPLINLPQG